MEESPPSYTPAGSRGKNPDGFYGGNTNTIWPNVKPFVNGFLAGQLSGLQIVGAHWFRKKTLDFNRKFINPGQHAQVIKASFTTVQKRMPAYLLLQATYTTAQFGSFDFLTKKVKAANGGIPLSLYQEAHLGMISGGIASLISYPLCVVHLASQLLEPNPPKLRSLLLAQYRRARRTGGPLVLWKNSMPYVMKNMGFNMGLFPSYHRSYSYLRDSVGLGNIAATFGAGIISCFIGTACCSLGRYSTYAIRAGGRRLGLFRDFVSYTPLTLVMWLNMEAIRGVEELQGL
ncbi:OLC1v1007478C1 [Oldenlandia corymbosa var. corymbosa]|uniref:OLC1v1007478C1 n=1 Tax=Oldenlandia corymbosa var. corymbosa TaxID=529605 RepID=A0AAV1DJC3_OLDCO|nr:OLC1v1007478C1 [Oldenlandia corymbosa var. corymbosa]